MTDKTVLSLHSSSHCASSSFGSSGKAELILITFFQIQIVLGDTNSVVKKWQKWQRIKWDS